MNIIFKKKIFVKNKSFGKINFVEIENCVQNEFISKKTFFLLKNKMQKLRKFPFLTNIFVFDKNYFFYQKI